MEFTAETTVDLRAMAALSRASRRTLGRRRSIAIHIFCWVVLVLDLLLSLLFWLGGDVPWLNLLLGLMLLGALLFEDRINGALGLRLVLPDTRQIQAVCETEDYFLLLLSRRHGQIYSKAGFTQGTLEAFRTFIAEKTGLPVPYIQ